VSIATQTDDDLIAEIERLQKSPEEIAAFLKGAPRFSAARWHAIAPPGTPEELAEMDEFLRDLNAERQRSLDSEAFGG
jgi:hypothetical protein